MGLSSSIFKSYDRINETFLIQYSEEANKAAVWQQGYWNNGRECFLFKRNTFKCVKNYFLYRFSNQQKDKKLAKLPA